MEPVGSLNREESRQGTVADQRLVSLDSKPSRKSVLGGTPACLDRPAAGRRGDREHVPLAARAAVAPAPPRGRNSNPRGAYTDALRHRLLLLALVHLFLPVTGGAEMSLSISSTAFGPAGEIPARFTCEGAVDSAPCELGRPTKAALETAMAGHVLARAELVGTYQRKKR